MKYPPPFDLLAYLMHSDWSPAVLALFGVLFTLLVNWHLSRQEYHRNLKREVILEAVVATQSAFRCLSLLLSPNNDPADVGDQYADSARSMAKLQAVATDNTLQAAGRLMGMVSPALAEMTLIRVKFERREASEMELINCWKEAANNYLPLWTDFVEAARKELGFTLDREGFMRWASVVNQSTLRVFDRMVREYEDELRSHPKPP